jgi:hypothetical protein
MGLHVIERSGEMFSKISSTSKKDDEANEKLAGTLKTHMTIDRTPCLD